MSPTETVGPCPSLSQFVRSDIREDRPGLPLNLTITVVNANSACAPVAGASVEIFADSLSQELATVSGNTTSGYNATFQVGIAL